MFYMLFIVINILKRTSFNHLGLCLIAKLVMVLLRVSNTSPTWLATCRGCEEMLVLTGGEFGEIYFLGSPLMRLLSPEWKPLVMVGGPIIRRRLCSPQCGSLAGLDCRLGRRQLVEAGIAQEGDNQKFLFWLLKYLRE